MKLRAAKLPLKEGYQLGKRNRCETSFYSYWKSSLPFARSQRAVLIHRPKSVCTIYWGDTIRIQEHSCAHFYCGAQTCFDSGRNTVTFESDIAIGKVLCERCEMMAVKAGLPSAENILGRHVCVGGVKAFNRCGCPITQNKGETI